ncbi:MAG TPA: TonB family protein [Rhizomicrobium sp.]
MKDRISEPRPRFAAKFAGVSVTVVVLAFLQPSVLAATTQDSTTPPKGRTETVIVTAPRDRPAAATVDMPADDNTIGTYVAVWPKSAYQTRANGEVTLSCQVDAYGLAESCSVASETPEGFGFGRAALELRPTFLLKPAMGPNGPIASTMALAIHFKPPISQFTSIADNPGRKADAEHPAVGMYSPVLGNALEMRDVTMMDHPVWVQAASFEDLARAYPAGAGAAVGYAVAHCRVESGGDLSKCQIIKETPDNMGFGKAALSLMNKFRILPELAATPSRTPLWVDLPIRFPPPAAAERPTVNAPVWLVRFDPDNAPRVFPPEAAAKGLTTGVGVARCVVGPDGSLTGCAPAAGDSDGLGFSEAAVTLASVMKMNLWSADAAPVVGATALVKIRMNLQ